MYNKRHTKLYYISLKESFRHNICLLCLQQNHIKKSGGLVNRHRDIWCPMGVSDNAPKHPNTPLIWGIRAGITQKESGFTFCRLLLLQVAHVVTQTLTSVDIPYQYTCCRIFSTTFENNGPNCIFHGGGDFMWGDTCCLISCIQTRASFLHCTYVEKNMVGLHNLLQMKTSAY